MSSVLSTGVPNGKQNHRQWNDRVIVHDRPRATSAVQIIVRTPSRHTMACSED